MKNAAPNDIKMQFYDHIRHGIRVKVLNFNSKAQMSFSSHYEQSFGVKAARLWNLLPRHVNEQSTLTGFKEALGAFLNKIPDTSHCWLHRHKHQFTPGLERGGEL